MRDAVRVALLARPGAGGDRLREAFRMAILSMAAHRLRTLLSATGIGIGIAAVILLTSIGEGIHQFVISEFTQFGTAPRVKPAKRTSNGTWWEGIGLRAEGVADLALAHPRILAA